ncbi:MAG: acyltransferase [Colwellia sp.]|jgi:Predicted acyltransferases
MLERMKPVFYKLVSVRETATENYFHVLDGWRGLSILFVLATHLLPLGPKTLRLNETFGPIGMALFFVLSGFLITNFLLYRPKLFDFIVRRFFRIIPLAWLYLLVALPILGADIDDYFAHFAFYVNWPPMSFVAGTSHFWSLCIEMQFYVAVALLFFMFKERAFYLIIGLCALVTLYRANSGVYIAINTYYRVDEILAGVIVAMAYNGKLGGYLPNFFKWVNPYYMMVLLLISCHPDSGFINYFRAYFAAILVASTLYNPPLKLANFLNMRILVYLASVSYALYVIHPLLAHTWLGSGDLFVKYLKRPLLFLVLFALAHLSTFYYEKYWISLAKKLSNRN